MSCTPQPVNPTPDADAALSDAEADAPAPFGVYDCNQVCAHAAQLGCPSAQPTKGGSSCAVVCANTLDGPAPFNLQCRSLATTCDAADACESNTLQARQRATADAGSDASDEAGVAAAPLPVSCAGWCTHATALGCPSAKPTVKGGTCVQVCTNVQTGPAKWNLKCRVAAKTCAAAEACQ